MYYCLILPVKICVIILDSELKEHIIGSTMSFILVSEQIEETINVLMLKIIHWKTVKVWLLMNRKCFSDKNMCELGLQMYNLRR